MKRNDTDVSFMPTLVSACCILHNLCEVHGDEILTMTGCVRKKQQMQQMLPMQLPMLQVSQQRQRQSEEHSAISSLEHALITYLNVLWRKSVLGMDGGSRLAGIIQLTITSIHPLRSYHLLI